MLHDGTVQYSIQFVWKDELIIIVIPGNVLFVEGTETSPN